MIDKADPEDILVSIVERLIDQIDQATDDSCYVTDQPMPIAMPSGRYILTVSLGDGNFPVEYFAGGGHDTITEQVSIVVSAIVAHQQDRPHRRHRRTGLDPNRNTDDTTPNLMYWRRSILKALLPDPSEWEINKNGEPLLRDQLSPSSTIGPRDVRIGDAMCSAIQISFTTLFDWKFE